MSAIFTPDCTKGDAAGALASDTLVFDLNHIGLPRKTAQQTICDIQDHAECFVIFPYSALDLLESTR